MEFIRNFPFFSIIICMFSGIISSVLSGKKARNLCFGAVSIATILSFCVLVYTIHTGEAYTYMMGHFPAPWGNEIRAGVLEGVLATTFSLILLQLIHFPQKSCVSHNNILAKYIAAWVLGVPFTPSNKYTCDNLFFLNPLLKSFTSFGCVFNKKL